MRGAAAVGVDDDLAAGQAGVALRAADDEAAGGVDVVLRILVEQLRGDDGLDDQLDHVAADRLERGLRRVLRGDDDRVDAHRAARLVVFDGDLGLSVGAEIIDQAALAHLGEALGQRVGQRDRQGHQLRRLAAGVAEHHALVAGAVLQLGVAALFALEGLVHAEGDVAGLLVDVDDDAAGVAVEAVLRAVVADLADDLARDLRDVDVAARGDLAHDVHETGRGRRLAGDAARRVLLEDRVEHGVGDLVADLVGMSLGDGFGSEKIMAHKRVSPEYFCSFRHAPPCPARAICEDVFAAEKPKKRRNTLCISSF